MTTELLTTSEASAVPRCSTRTLRRSIAAGALPVVVDGRRTLVRRCDLDVYIARRVRCRTMASAPMALDVRFAAGSDWWRT
jgi:excisionase family DNA binding protein